MKTTTILFDLDGTLLPMDMEEFTRGYFGLLVKRMAPRGYEKKALIDAVWAGTAAMVNNDGSCTNEEAFWARFCQLLGPEKIADKPEFEAFYREDFHAARQFCGLNPQAAKTIRLRRELGFHAALATNPIFPATATESRIRWAGLEPEDFELYTTYENCRSCKPNPAYYREVVQKIHVSPEECVMVGNDVQEDMVASTLGMKVFLLTDCLIDRADSDLSLWPHGGFDELMAFLRQEASHE